MASLPNPQTVTYEEWFRMPEVTDFIEEVVDGEIPDHAAKQVESHADRREPARCSSRAIGQTRNSVVVASSAW